ncbi:HEPN domain-containing protein [Anoxybacillus flavithermus]|uniref:RiboL-PSP-HEPN domain-containing protein n=1 Tax=Anoxybacillus flavithermus AK1 TaxID=1297581 RepID=M8D5V4_9BACL|nr:HEPN domain-containing protein [Anoxybacillus flavithermus]EMT46231.1 hypothetical protein H919_06531 [Anoxybacillus flavithermus AK1]
MFMSKERFLKNISLTRESRQLEKRRVVIAEQKANDIMNQFQYNIQSIREKFAIYDELFENGKKQHAEDVLRSQIVFLMSALDFYMHEIVRYRLLKMFSGEIRKTESYKTFIVSLQTVEEALKNPETIDWLSEEIILRHSHKTFMASKAIKEVLSLISREKIFAQACQALQTEHTTATKYMDDIYRRRNEIAHQADRPHNEEKQHRICKEEVEQYIDFIEKFVQHVHRLLMEEESKD